VTLKGFRKCYISSAIDKTDDKQRNSSEEGRNVRGESEEDEDTDCEDGDSNSAWKRQKENDMLCILSV
jgi:hypothetical protein